MFNMSIFKRFFAWLIFFAAFGVFNNALAENVNIQSGSTDFHGAEKTLLNDENKDKKAETRHKITEKNVNDDKFKNSKKSSIKKEDENLNDNKDERMVETISGSNSNDIILPEVDDSAVNEAIDKQAENQVAKQQSKNILQTLLAVCMIFAGIAVIIKALIDGLKAPCNYSPGYKQKYSAKNKKRKKYNIKF